MVLKLLDPQLCTCNFANSKLLSIAAYQLKKIFFDGIIVQLLSRVQLFCDPMGYIACQTPLSMGFQARILEWVAISFSRGTS